MSKRTVSVIGLGYVGLPTAALLADCGFLVKGMDTNPDVIRRIRNADFFSAEPGLSELVRSGIDSGILEVSEVLEKSDVFIVCVPTPVAEEHNRKFPDLRFIDNVVEHLLDVLEPGNLLLVESTCPPGTTEAIRLKLEDGSVDTKSLDIAYCPERILPGSILAELRTNPRLVGGLTESASLAARDFYASFLDVSIVRATAVEAELTKIAENSFRDVNLAFSNELSIIAQSYGVDPFRLVTLANLHPRVKILTPGTGPGGHCVPVDPWFVISARPEITPLMQTARAVNDGKANWIVNQIVDRYNLIFETESPVDRRPIICLGATYKADTEDVRESRALAVCEGLRRRGMAVEIVDPFLGAGSDFPTRALGDIEWETCLVVALVPHSIFRSLSKKIEDSNLSVMDFCGLGADYLAEENDNDVRTFGGL